MIYCAVCDDNRYYLKMIEPLLSAAFSSAGGKASFMMFSEPEALLSCVKEGKVFDVCFLDIEMPTVSGFEVAKLLREQNPACLIVFLTSHVECAIDAYELDVFRFLPKIDVEARVGRCVADIIKRLDMQSDSYYVIQSANKWEKIPYKMIKYAKKDGKYVYLVCTNGRQVKLRKTLTDFVEELGKKVFIGAERGYVVNLAHVSKVDDGGILLDDGEVLPVSKIKMDEIKNALTVFWGGII